jgi:hypothetical protein
VTEHTPNIYLLRRLRPHPRRHLHSLRISEIRHTTGTMKREEKTDRKRNKLNNSPLLIFLFSLSQSAHRRPVGSTGPIVQSPSPPISPKSRKTRRKNEEDRESQRKLNNRASEEDREGEKSYRGGRGRGKKDGTARRENDHSKEKHSRHAEE